MNEPRRCSRTPLCVFLAALLATTFAAAGDDPATDKSEYQRKMSECQSQLSGQHPDMDAKARRKACKAQVGPQPQGVVPAKAPAPVR